MGLASWALSRIWKPLGLGVQIGKLINDCKDSRFLTGPRLLRIAEEIVIFLVRQEKGNKAALVLYAGKVIVRKVQNNTKADRAIALLSTSTCTYHSDGLVDKYDIDMAMRDFNSWPQTEFSQASKTVQDAIAGIMYIQILMELKDLESIASMYQTKEGRFNAAACLRDFYGNRFARGLFQMVSANVAAARSGRTIETSQLDHEKSGMWKLGFFIRNILAFNALCDMTSFLLL